MLEGRENNRPKNGKEEKKQSNIMMAHRRVYLKNTLSSGQTDNLSSLLSVYFGIRVTITIVTIAAFPTTALTIAAS